MSHIRSATGNTARVLQMLQHPTPALVAYYHRVCYQQLADIAAAPDPDNAAHNMPLHVMATPESSVEYLLQARDYSIRYGACRVGRGKLHTCKPGHVVALHSSALLWCTPVLLIPDPPRLGPCAL